MWFKDRSKYRIVEIKKPRLANVEDEELRASLRALGNMPSFNFLLDRAKTQSSLLESRLKTTRFDESKIAEIAWLQAGIFWLNWIERDHALLTKQPPKPELPATDQELQAFRQIDALLERVGIEDEPQAQE